MPGTQAQRQSGGEEAPDMEDSFGETEVVQIRAYLLGWYGLNRRDLPWRLAEADTETRAYRVWVSEVMLQQTRVQTVISYFDRWMRKWPTLRHLSQASLEEVNEMWAGLGYYRRARYLLQEFVAVYIVFFSRGMGAKMVVAGKTEFPNNVSSLLKVPGIGNYTAGAIASIAFKEVVPLVDGNVVRVIARLRAISANPKDSKTVKKLWELAAQLVDPLEPGDFNQSLMELGATLCTLSNPSCSSCPISDQCRALSISKSDSSVLVTDYPVKVTKMKPRREFSAVCVLEILKDEEASESEFLLVKRPEEGLLAGLWEFPSVLLDGEADEKTRRKAIDRYLKDNFKIDFRKIDRIDLREHVGEFVHVFSHIRLKIFVELFTLRIKGNLKDIVGDEENESMPWKCVDSKVISSMGLTSSVRKVYTMAHKFKQQNFYPNPTQRRSSNRKPRRRK